MFGSGSLTLFRIRGVPVRLHWTLLLIIAYLAIALSYQFVSIAVLAAGPAVPSSTAVVLPC